MRMFLCLLTTIAMLTACAKQPSLEEKLAAAATPAEREKIAYSECLKNARYQIPGGHSRAYVGHETRQLVLCDEMHNRSGN